MPVSSKKKRGQQRKAVKKEALIFNTITRDIVSINSDQKDHIATYIKNGSDRVTRVLATKLISNFSYNGVVNVVLDFLNRCEDEMFHKLVNTNIKGNINTPSLWIDILDMAQVPEEEESNCRLHIAENIGPLVRCMCNDTKRLFYYLR